MSNIDSFSCIFAYRKVCAHSRNNKIFVPLMIHTIIDIFTKYEVVTRVCTPFPTPIYACKSPELYWILKLSSKRSTLCHSVAIVMQWHWNNYYVFLDVIYTSLHIHQNNFHNVNFKFLLNFRPKSALNSPTPLNTDFQFSC